MGGKKGRFPMLGARLGGGPSLQVPCVRKKGIAAGIGEFKTG